MTTPEDRDLDALLAEDGGKLGTLYRRLPRAEPSRRLDRAVLGNAARAVRGQAPRRQRWAVTFGSMAGIVLAAGIAWHVGQDALRQQALRESGRGAPIVVPIKPLSAPDRRADQHEVATRSPAVMPTPTPEPHHDVESSARAMRPAAPVEVPAPAPPAPEPPTPSISARSAEPFPAGSAESGQSRRQDAAAAPSRRAAPKPQTEQRALAPTSDAVPTNAMLAPDAKIARIRLLLQEGHRAQAIEAMRVFERAHPDYPLPADLRALHD